MQEKQRQARITMQKKMLAEAEKRIEILQKMGLWEEVRNVWEKNTACFSKPMNLFGELTGVTFTFNEDEELKAIKEKLEKKTGYVVYYGIYSDTMFGRLLSLMVVTPYTNEWSQERKLLEKGYADVYCYNLDEQFGECGRIAFQVANGGLIQTE